MTLKTDLNSIEGVKSLQAMHKEVGQELESLFDYDKYQGVVVEQVVVHQMNLPAQLLRMIEMKREALAKKAFYEQKKIQAEMEARILRAKADSVVNAKMASATRPEITIGKNGNWFINGIDTGRKAK